MTLNDLIYTLEHMDELNECLITVLSYSDDCIVGNIPYTDFKNEQLSKILGDTDIIKWKIDRENETNNIVIKLNIPTIDEETLFYVGVGVKTVKGEQNKAVIVLNTEEMAVLNKLLLNDKSSIYTKIDSGVKLETQATLEIYNEPAINTNKNIESLFGNASMD